VKHLPQPTGQASVAHTDFAELMQPAALAAPPLTVFLQANETKAQGKSKA
jgi:hypothetical protein